jgi:hypothetical protein
MEQIVTENAHIAELPKIEQQRLGMSPVEGLGRGRKEKTRCWT